MVTKQPAIDLVAIIEAAYRLDVDEPAWIRGLTEAAAPLLDDGHGLAGYLVDTTGAGPAAHTPTLMGTDPWQGAWRERWWEGRVARMPANLIGDLAGFGSPAYASESCGAVLQGAVVQRLARTIPPLPLPPGVGEALVVCGFDPCGAGAVLFAFREARVASSRQETARFQRISVHVAAAIRLRKRRGDGQRVGAASVDRARLRKYRKSDEALDLWPASLDGQSIVPAQGGYLAFDNAPEGAPLSQLSQRERSVASLVSLGRSNKAIAYELGIAPSTVSTLLTSAARKLRVKGVEGLIGRARGGVQTLPRASQLARERGLTETETAVLCLLLAGLPDAEIAELRACSRGTITKQVDAVFKKLRVGSRRELLSSFAPWRASPRG